MKKALLFFATIFSHLCSQGQYIQNISYDPVFPGPTDSVKILLELEFPSGDCVLNYATYDISNDSIRIEVFHCPGPLAFICNVTDTVNIGTLAQGNYYTEVIVHKKIYVSPDPCAGSSPVDSVDFSLTVLPGSAVGKVTKANPFVYFQSQSKSIILAESPRKNTHIILFNLLGSIVKEGVFDTSNRLPVPDLSKGVYLYTLTMEDGKTGSGKFSIQ